MEAPNSIVPKIAETNEPIEVLHAVHTRVSLEAGRGGAAGPPPYASPKIAETTPIVVLTRLFMQGGGGVDTRTHKMKRHQSPELSVQCHTNPHTSRSPLCQTVQHCGSIVCHAPNLHTRGCVLGSIPTLRPGSRLWLARGRPSRVGPLLAFVRDSPPQ